MRHVHRTRPEVTAKARESVGWPRTLAHVDPYISSGLFALGGALVGGASSVASQWLTAHNSERAARRAEMRVMLREFLIAAKGPERMVERKRYGEDISWSEMADLTDRMWLAHQVMEAFCPGALVDAAKTYIEAIYEEFKSDAPGNMVGQLMNPARERLTLEARRTFSDYM